MKSISVKLIIEKGKQGLWGTVNYNDNLTTGLADNLPELEEKIQTHLHQFEGIDPAAIVFNYAYDVCALFQEFDFLNISKVAKYADINAGLLRQYAAGVKYPSLNQAKKIEETLHYLAVQLQNASVYAA